ncbi:uncharacterized protein EAF02_012133 [Botrytis sinoallii]|uniref:uncharacterized protein n=1 Tax=Botrytis sinoallii TaxID=1463999 RepID=UPI0019029C7D|nr:uncharacterized protein EAF02_012133 [Botrytis sinoallii]KAF7852903.1 hypothetical protein EAF02_012133 [Botrytis sinoallii]
MLSSKPKITALGLSLLPASLAQLSDLSVFPPGGPGTILVTLNGHGASTGCLNDQGLWTVKDTCASFEGNGQGGLGSDLGYIILDSSSSIVTTTGTWSTAWVGTHINQGRDAILLQAQIGTTGAAPWGGPLWYANAQPDDTSNVALNGHSITDSVQVTLTFNSTFIAS